MSERPTSPALPDHGVAWFHFRCSDPAGQGSRCAMLTLPRGLSRLCLGLTTKNHERNNGVVSLRPRKRHSYSTHKPRRRDPTNCPIPYLLCFFHVAFMIRSSPFGAGVRRKGLNGSVYAAPGSAEAGGRANPFRAATLVCTQHGPGKQNKKPLRLRSLDHIELPGYHDGVVLDKFVPFSGTKWLTNAKRFIHQPGRRGGR